ncbi:MAG: EutN/CcmL family microcompartment protein [Pseudomonadota bacterium]
MKTGIVVGKVWATKRLDQLPGGALLEIAIEEEDETDERMVAFDPLGAGIGERVLITQGSVAKAWFKDGSNVVDALVIGILDEQAAPAKSGKKS